MIPSLSYFLLGHTTVAVSEDGTARLLEVCRRLSIPYENFQSLEDGGISLRFTDRNARRLWGICAGYGIPLTPISRGGLPKLLRRLLHRPGLWVGGILGLVLCLAHSRCQPCAGCTKIPVPSNACSPKTVSKRWAEC